MDFKLHPRLQEDCLTLGLINNCSLLLNKNALVPWFILVPHTTKTEIFQLDNQQQSQLHQTVNLLASFVKSNFNADKLNIATIGNIVPQLHIHIVGRFQHDFCWPQPVWGQTQRNDYSHQELLSIKQSLISQDILVPADT